MREKKEQAVVRLGKRGTVVIPAPLRTQLGLQEGDLLVVEVRQRGLLLRPAIAVAAVEIEAAQMLVDAPDADAYAEAYQAVRALGVDPSKIKHRPPG